MIMWTIVSDEILWQQEETSQPRQLELRLGSRVLLLEVDQGGNARVSRLISSDPSDYLDPKFQPGSSYPLSSSS